MAESITGGGLIFPPLLDNAPKSLPVSFTSYALGLTNGGISFIGRMFIADRSASKILSAAGGGAISFLTGASSLTATAAVHAIGIQDVDAVNGPPGRPDNTFDVSTTLTGSTGSHFPANTWVTKTMTSGGKTLSHGQLYAFVIRATANASAGGLRIRAPVNTTGGGSSAFVVTLSATTIVAPTLAPAGTPNVLFQCDDGTLAWLAGSTALSSVTAVSISSGGTNDEYGMRFVLPWTSQVDGLGVRVGGISTANYNIILYSDPNGTPATVTSIAILGAQQPTSVTGVSHLIPITPVTLTASTTYLLAVKPAGTPAITMQCMEFAATANKISFPAGGSLGRGARADGAGAFSILDLNIPCGFQVRINQISAGGASTVTATTTTTITTTITTTVTTVGGGMLVHPGLTGGFRG